ncbi:MAG: histidinol-phosphate transaminase [Thermodesulfobacteriota bacterium]|nr:histidinol-phosphate transaminase [Thermodesulfobacteriota bacterium]
MNIKPPDYILSITPYSPGKPIEELERELGIQGSIKLASNENPLGPSPLAVDAIRQGLDRLHRYPDGSGYYLVEKLADFLGVNRQQIVLGNGSDDIIGMLTKAMLYPGDEVVMTDPSFSMYEITTRVANAVPVTVPLDGLAIDLEAVLGAVTPKTRMVFLTNPNNPTGTIISWAAFEAFMAKLPAGVILVMDEAYIEFVREPDCLNGLEALADERVVVLRTFSKAYGLAGLRVGYGVMSPELAALLNRIRQPFNVNSLAQAAAIAALDDTAFLARTLETVHGGLDFLCEALAERNIPCYPSQANFFLIDLQKAADPVFDALLKKGVIVRSMRSYGYPDYIRVTVGTHEENVRFLNVLAEVLP